LLGLGEDFADLLGSRLVDGSISGATYLGVTANLKGMEIATEIALAPRPSRSPGSTPQRLAKSSKQAA